MNLKNLLIAVAAMVAAVATPSSAATPATTAKPFVVPELRDWKAADGFFTPTAATRVVCRSPRLLEVARQFAADYQKLTGVSIPVEESGRAAKGDFEFTLKTDRKKSAESYGIDIADKVSVTAPGEAGARWAAQTLLQMTEAGRDLPKGRIADWPDYGYRGLMIDVGRKYIPMDYLYRLVDVLAYYKMNVLHIHLNDNGFKYYFDDDWDKTQAAFRLESERFPELTARDGSYTKQEFRDLQNYAASKGIEIVPEIDFPAHSLAFTRLRPEIGSSNDEYGCDHLNLFEPRTYEFLDSLLDEYIGGENPVFQGPRMHIGTDEYSNRDSATVEKFRYLTDRYIRFVEERGKKPVVWGALTHARGKQPVKVDGVEMYCWYNGYAEPDSMLSLGYDIVSIPDGWVYIVPGAGYYYDYLNNRNIYEKWSPAVIGNKTIDPAHPQLKGGMFAVWNDHPNNGLTVKDIHHRVMSAMPAMASKNWEGANVTLPYEEFDSLSRTLSEAPGVNYLSRRKADADGVVLSLPVVQPGASTGIDDIGYDYAVEFDLEGADEKPGTVLFQSPEATFWLSDPITGNMGFSREGYLNSFRFNVRPGEKSHVRIEGDNKSTRLYVNGRLVDDLNIRWMRFGTSDRKMAQVRTLVFPLAKAGAFKSRVTNLKVTNM